MKVKPEIMWAVVVRKTGRICWNSVYSSRRAFYRARREQSVLQGGKPTMRAWRKAWKLVRVIVKEDA